MIRYLVLSFLCAGALVAEETIRSLPYVGFFSPDMGLLLVMVYALKTSGKDLSLLCFLAGLLKGSLGAIPGGFFVLMYLAAGWIVLRIRRFLFVEYGTTQAVLVFLAACLMEGGALAGLALGLLPALKDYSFPVVPLSSGIAAAFLAPLAVRIHDRSRFLSRLLER